MIAANHCRLTRFRPRQRVVVLAVAGLLLLPIGCAARSSDDQHSNGTVGQDAPGAIIVSTAASLALAFGAIREAFLASHPGDAISLNVGSSGQLAQQLESGAAADVVAFADIETMNRVERQELIRSPFAVFATTQMALATKPTNPLGIKNLDDVVRARSVSLCVDSAPCGRYADAILASAKVFIDESLITRGLDARATIGAVVNGDADIAIVYEPDLIAAGDRVHAMSIPSNVNQKASFTIASSQTTQQQTLSEQFVSFVQGLDGQSILHDFGFSGP